MKTQRFDEGISVYLAQKTHVPRTWVHFCFIKMGQLDERGWIANFWSEIEAI